MEFYALSTSVARTIKIYEATKLKENFPTVDVQAHALVGCAILVLKSLLVGFGMRKLPGAMTFWMLTGHCLKCCICATGFYAIFGASLNYFMVICVLFLFKDESLHPAASALIIVAVHQDPSFEFFIDFYIGVLLTVYIYRLYENEIDKTFALISYLYCLDWFTDYMLESKSIGMMHAILSLHLPIFLLTAFSPSNSRTLYKFLYLAFGLALWQMYKLAKTALIKGVTGNRYFILDETLDKIKSTGGKFYKIFDMQ